MKQTIAFLFFAFPLVAPTTFQQRAVDFEKIDDCALNIPSTQCKTVVSLARALKNCADSDLGKTRAAYTWVCSNIRYADTVVTYNWLGTPENEVQQRPDNVLKKRTGVCEGISNLFVALCREMGVEAHYVTGIVKKQTGQVSDLGHVWAAAKIENRWALFDPTWDTKDSESNLATHFYFDAPSDSFALNHYPEDPIWQLLQNPMYEAFFQTNDSLKILEWVHAKPKKPFVFHDTIRHHFSLDSLQQLDAEAERTLRFNPKDEYAMAHLGQSYYNRAVRQSYHLDTLLEGFLNAPSLDMDLKTMENEIKKPIYYMEKAYTYFRKIKKTNIEKQIESWAKPISMRVNADFWMGLLHIGIVRGKAYLSADNLSAAFQKLSEVQTETKTAERYFERAGQVLEKNQSAKEFNPDLLSRIEVYRAELDRANAYILHATATDYPNQTDYRKSLKLLDEALANLEAMRKRLLALDDAKLNIYGGNYILLSYPGMRSQIHIGRAQLNSLSVGNEVEEMDKNPLKATPGAVQSTLDKLRKNESEYTDALIYARQSDEYEHLSNYIYFTQASDYFLISVAYIAAANYEIRKNNGELNETQRAQAKEMLQKSLEAVRTERTIYQKMSSEQKKEYLQEVQVRIDEKEAQLKEF